VRIHARKVRSFARWSAGLPNFMEGIEAVIGIAAAPAPHQNAR
jgi:hypothetical protein